MLIHLDTRSGVPIYRQVMEQVTRAILSGQLQVEDKLESVAELSRRLKVNPMTISKAYGFLVEEGLLVRRAGIGLFVRSVQEGKKRKAQDKLLTGAMDKACLLAMELGMQQAEASRLFNDHFKKNFVKHEEK